MVTSLLYAFDWHIYNDDDDGDDDDKKDDDMNHNIDHNDYEGVITIMPPPSLLL